MKQYQELEIEIIFLKSEDIICNDSSDEHDEWDD